MKFSHSIFQKMTIAAITAGGMLHACGSTSFKGSGDGTQITRNEALPPSTGPAAPLVPASPGRTAIVPAATTPQNTTTNTVQTIGGIINTIRNNIDISRTDREIIFGGDKVFHIGDGQFSASTCQRQLSAYSLSGTKYSFEFEVIEDLTVVQLDVLTVCGVDYSDSNFINLVQSDSKTIDKALIRAGVSRAGLNTITLGKGHYAIMVESTRNTTAGVDGGDNDDFIVGQVRVRASKNITAGDVKVQ